jgi:Predicted AAA-ATPase/PD-(D/E)XK nuclease superfamily
MSQKLPLGLQDFRGIIRGAYKYIDKTRFLYELCNNGKYYFMARPRRFGKSLTISALHALYTGEKELFQGLWIAEYWDWKKKPPIIHMSFTTIDFQTLGLKVALEQEITQVSKTHQISLETMGVLARFKELLTQMSPKGPVVVLIDEYDAPITFYLGKDDEQAFQNRNLLHGFYAVLKDMDAALEFVFITGVSKFSKVGIFSGMNNLNDLSMHPQYAIMLGYTQQELEANFGEEIDQTALALKLDRNELLEKLRYWYNGYRFEENAETVYNPVSINKFFNTRKFDNFWFETGTPTFLMRLLKQKGLYNFRLNPQSKQSFDSFELEDLNVYGLLYQAGYLSIKSKDEYGLFELDYPNFEVQNAMTANLLEVFSGLEKGESLPLVSKIEKFLVEGSMEKVIVTLQGLFKSIPYFQHEKYPEKFFHAAIHLLFTYMGINIRSEVCTNDGRIDAVVETADQVFIFEFKLDQSADLALTQIRKKQYYQAFWHKNKPITGVGINFSSEEKNIQDWKMEVY